MFVVYTIAVVVRIGAAVAVLEAFTILGELGTPVVVVGQTIAIVIFGGGTGAAPAAILEDAGYPLDVLVTVRAAVLVLVPVDVLRNVRTRIDVVGDAITIGIGRELGFFGSTPMGGRVARRQEGHEPDHRDHAGMIDHRRDGGRGWDEKGHRVTAYLCHDDEESWSRPMGHCGSLASSRMLLLTSQSGMNPNTPKEQ